MLRSLSRWLSAPARRTARPRWQPQVNQLEDRSTPASFAGNTIILDDVNEVLTISTSTTGTYRLSSTADVNGTAGPVNFTPGGGVVSVIDAVGGTAVLFANSTVNYANAFTITLDGGSFGVGFSGATNFGANNLSVTTDRSIGVGGGASVATSGGNIAFSANQQGSATGGDFTGVGVSGLVTAGGSGTVTVAGRGGSGGGVGNYGVLVAGAGSFITSNAGSVTVTGTGGGGNGGAAVGVHVVSAGQIRAGGSGTVSVTGTGGAGTGQGNYGVLVQFDVAAITSGGGNVTVTGTGGGGGTGGTDVGVFVFNNGQITAGAGGKVTVTGTGGAGSGYGNYGVLVAGTSAAVYSGGGNVSVTGTGGSGTGGANIGVHVALGGQVSAGTGGTVSVTGSGVPSGGAANFGVLVQNVPSAITSTGGSVTVTGAGGGVVGGYDTGVFVNAGGQIRAGNSGAVSVTGASAVTGQFGGFGVYVAGVGSAVTSSGGAVSVTGGGGNGATGASIGVHVSQGGQITASGAGTVAVSGFGYGSGGKGNYGVLVQSAGSAIASSGGAVTVQGSPGFTGSERAIGVFVTGAGQITAGGAGAVNVTGDMPAGSGGVLGAYSVRVDGSAAAITSSGGPVNVLGNTRGVYVVSGGQITAGLTGAVAVSGSGNQSIGVYVGDEGFISGAGSAITSAGGSVTVTGTSGGSSDSTAFTSVAVHVNTGGLITAGGTGTVSVTGTYTSGFGRGVDLFSNGTLAAAITSGGGAVSVEAISAGVGVYLYEKGVITSGANAPITVTTNGLGINPNAGNVISTGGVLTIRPQTAGTTIALGGADAPSGSPRVLGLLDQELNLITAGALIVGSPAAGNITLSQNITRPYTVHLVTGGNIAWTGAGRLNTGGGLLTLTAAAVIPANPGFDLAASTVSFAAGTDLAVSINGTAADSQYTFLNVNGGLNLTGADLVLSGAHVATAGQVFYLAAGTSLTGTFNGLANGSTVNFNGRTLRINYTPTAAIATAL